MREGYLVTYFNNLIEGLDVTLFYSRHGADDSCELKMNMRDHVQPYSIK